MDILEIEEYILPVPIEELPPIDSCEVQEFLSAYNATPNVCRLLDYLLRLQFSVDELRQGLRDPRFFKYCATILGAFSSFSAEMKIASIRRVLAQIGKLSDAEIATASTVPAPSPTKKEQKSKGKQRSKFNCNTLRRLSVLAALYQQQNGLPIGEIEQRSCLKLRALRDALKDLESAGYVEKKKAKVDKHPPTNIYSLTHCGITYLILGSVQELQYTIQNKFCIVYCTSCTLPSITPYQLSEFIREAIQVVEELRKLGWRDHRCIRNALRENTTEYILAQIEKIKAKGLENPGGYLMRILVRPKSEMEQRADIATKNLAGLPEDLVRCYHEEAQHMTKDKARHFACVLRKQYKKSQANGEPFFPGQVDAVANYVRNRRGVRRKKEKFLDKIKST